MTDSLVEYAVFAARLADAARRETLPRFRARGAIEDKGGAAFDPVTDADREAERAMRRLIAAVYPDHGILGEEFGAERSGAPLRWVLDPVDGTRAFVCGAPTWTTLIAFEADGAPLIGIIDQPFTDERWMGFSARTVWRRGGAEVVCRTSGCKDLGEARLSTTDPRAEGYFSATEADAFSTVAAKCQVARFSFDAYAYGLLALGEIDLIVEASLQRHDWSALVPAVEGAGGVISGWKGEPLADSLRGRIVAAATATLHAAAVEFLCGV